VRLFRLFPLVLDGDADPFIEKAFSRKRSESLSKTNSMYRRSAIRFEGVIFVPRLRVLPVCFRATTGIAAGVLLFVGQSVRARFPGAESPTKNSRKRPRLHANRRDFISIRVELPPACSLVMTGRAAFLVDMMKKEKRSAAEVVMTKLHAGGEVRLECL